MQSPGPAIGKKFEWERLGRVFSPSDVVGHPWIVEYAQSPAVLVMGDRLRIFFCSRERADVNGNFLSRLFFVDLNKENPTEVISISTRPVVGLGELGTFDEFGMTPVSVTTDDDGRVFAYYSGWTRTQTTPFNSAIGLVFSEDGGSSFTRAWKGPVLGHSLEEPFVTGSPRVKRFGGKWFMWYVSGKRWLPSKSRPEPVYKIRMATSDNGMEWKPLLRDLIPDRLGADECQAAAEVFLYDGSYHMFFSFRPAENFKSGKHQYRLGYATSKDLLHWEREDFGPGLEFGKSGWDDSSLSYTSVFNLDNDYFSFYQGNLMGHSGFGLAKFREKLS